MSYRQNPLYVVRSIAFLVMQPYRFCEILALLFVCNWYVVDFPF